VPDLRIRYLYELCSTCGTEVVNDNLNTGRPWLHVMGEPADGHPVKFGTLVPRDDLAKIFAPRQEVVDEAADDAADKLMANHPVQVHARTATQEEIGESARLGRRQILNLAKRMGFTTEARFSRGPVADQYGRWARDADSLLIAGWHPDDSRMFVAWWLADAHGELQTQTIKCAGLVGPQSVKALKDYLRG